MKNSGLGRGLGALMGEDITIETGIDREYVHQLPIGSIDVNKAQPRKTFHNETIASLAESIKANGMLQPITVRKVGQRYEIVAGERRFRACRLLKMQTIPAIVKELSPRQVCELSLIENLQREDLNPIEAATAMRSLMEDYGMTQDELADRIGKSRPAITNTLRLLQLTPEVIRLVETGALSSGHARAIITVPAEDQIRLANKFVKDGCSVRDAEQQVKDYFNPPEEKKKKKPELSLELKELIANMQRVLGTKVNAIGNDNKGRIYIDYYTRDDLDRLAAIVEFAERSDKQF